jgi:hypothetical protein
MFGFRRKSGASAGGSDTPVPGDELIPHPDSWARTIVDLPLGRARPLSPLSVEHGEKEGTRQVPLDEEKFKIRLATTQDRRESASLLIQKMYSWRGYATGTPLQPTDPNRITLVAGMGDAVIGTLTIGFDSPAGLLADEMYKEEIDRLRARGARIGELIKLAADRSTSSMQVLAALFHLAYIYGRNIHGLTDAVIEVNPNHVGFYQKVLGFERIGEEKMCPRANAPAVLLHLGHQYLTEQIRKFGGQGARAVGERTLYPYFFSPEEEAGITERLMHGH